MWANYCIRQFVLKVSDYRTDQGWKNLSLIFENLKLIMTMLNSMVINNKRDEVIWGDNPSGYYSVASGYNSLWSLKEKPPWVKAWLPCLTPKINIFYWLALQDKILTQDNLIKRGHIMPKRCILCKNQMELVNHILIHFSFSREVWDNITKIFGVIWCKLGNLLDFF